MLSGSYYKNSILIAFTLLALSIGIRRKYAPKPRYNSLSLFLFSITLCRNSLQGFGIDSTPLHFFNLPWVKRGEKEEKNFP